MQARQSRFFWPIFLVLLIAGLFIPNLVMRVPALDIPQSRDLANQWNPYYHFLRDSYLLYHSFPLWNPYDLCGTPFLAFTHTSALYLLNGVYLLAQFPTAMSLSVLLHLIIAGLGCYYLVRSLGASGQASFICGMAYALSGFVFNNLNFPPSFYSASWLPWVFFFAAGLVRHQSLGRFLGLALATGLGLYGGDLELALFGVLVIFAWLVLVKPWAGSLVWKPALLYLFGVALAGLLYLAQLLPSMEMMHFSIRSAGQIGLSITIKEVGLALAGIAGSIVYPYPMKTGEFAPLKGMNWFYLGVVPVLGFLAGMAREKRLRNAAWIFLAAAAYAFLSSTRVFSPVFSRVPLLGQSLVPFRLYPVMELLFLIIAGQGLSCLTKDPPAKFFRPAALLLFLLGAGSLGLSIIARNSFPPGGLQMRLAASILCLAAALTLNSPKAGSALRSSASERRTRWILLGLALLDLYGWSLLHFPRTAYARFDLNPELEMVANTDPDSRYFIFGTSALDTELPYSAGMMLKASTINSWTRLPPKNYAEILALLFPETFQMENGRIRFYDQAATQDLSRASANGAYLFNLLNVRWGFSRLDLPAATSRFQFQEKSSDPVYVYENPHFLPRAFLAKNSIRLDAEQELLKQMALGKFDYQNTLLLSKNAPADGHALRVDRAKTIPQSKVLVSRPIPDQLVAEFNALAPAARFATRFAWMFLSETWYPGWKAFIDEKEQTIFPADFAFRAVKVRQGEQRVEFRYQPASFELGLFASIASALMLITLWIARQRRPRI